MYRILMIVCMMMLATNVFSQSAEPFYRSEANEHYWGHRPPVPGYWQQDVIYNISAYLDEEKHLLDGSVVLEYYNNSPDTLYHAYFRLFQEAFVKGSYLHELQKEKKLSPRLGPYERQGLGTVVTNVTVGGTNVYAEMDNTIMKVILPKPLLPGDKTTFYVYFKTFFDDQGSTRRRMKMYDAWGYKHYNGVQWFPKICVYDSKFGWDTYQHLNKEFYGEFGSYHVSLNMPNNFIVEATGVLENREQVLPDTLREKLDLKNFANKKWNEPPSTIIPYEKRKRKTWRYTAHNVHDFAFTADPSYRIGGTTWNGVECVAIVQEPHAAGWQNAPEYVAKIIKTFSEDIGMYAYPKMVAADAADGMEYPMITLDGGRDPGYRGLLVHEIGHNWFYGMVGSNETYRAAMDEGFTQFLTGWGLKKLEGDTMYGPPAHWYKKKFYEPQNVRDVRVYNAYVYDALNKQELPLNTHSNDFHDALHHEGGYRQVYYKPATMLYNLQYVLGDSLFLAAMQHYFHQWKFAHPYFEDFRNSIIQFTNVDLNWFFDQWLETTKTADYGIKDIDKLKGNDSFAIRFSRKGLMQMPIDFTVTAKDGKKYSYHIPNTWFEKETKATTLPKWYGWGKIQPDYTAKVGIPSGIRHIEIDTSDRLADMYMLDNYKTRGLPVSPKAIKVKVDGGVNTPMDRKHYKVYVRPDIWWNAVDGIKAGVHAEGDYLNTMHRFNATVWWSTHLLQKDIYEPVAGEDTYEKYAPINYTFNYYSPVTRNLPSLELQLNSRFLDGLMYHRGGFNWKVNDNNIIQFYAQTMWRPLSYDYDYLVYPYEWSSGQAKPNSSLNLAWIHAYEYKRGVGQYRFNFRAPFLTNAFDYSYGQVEAINYNRLGRLQVRTRLFGRYGLGNNLPYESMLWLAGANPEELMDNKYTRSVGFVPNDWQGISRYETNHFQIGGGLNLRGYAGYFVADERDGQVLIGYKGRSGLAGNIEVDVDDYIRVRPRFTRNWLHIDAYAFADAGVIELNYFNNNNNYWNTTPAKTLSDIRVDAGVGFAFTIKKWWWFDKAEPLTLRFDMPLFINRPPYANPQYANFRYVIGVNRTF